MTGTPGSAPVAAWSYGYNRRAGTPTEFPLLAAAAWWAQRPDPTARRARPHVGDLGGEWFGDPDWMWVGDRRMFVVGFTAGGALYGCYEDDFDDLPQPAAWLAHSVGFAR